MSPAVEQSADTGNTVADRLRSLRTAVEDAVRAAGREPGAVRMLLATKTVEPARIIEAFAAGYRLIGENRVQELLAKRDDLSPHAHETHVIGHLQSNKVNQIVGRIDCLQTLDSVELALRLQRRLEAMDLALSVFVQVNVSGEVTKAGVPPQAVDELIAQVAGCDRLAIRGLMTIGLNSSDRTAVRAGYATLRRLRDRLRESGRPGTEQLAELSMGMSGDFSDAIAEGATMIRIGSAVFGPRG